MICSPKESKRVHNALKKVCPGDQISMASSRKDTAWYFETERLLLILLCFYKSKSKQ